jgi:hypothetical protein
MSIQIHSLNFEGPFSSTVSLAHRSGIYVVLAQTDGNTFQVIDVGESSDVKDRIENHDRSLCWARNVNGKPIVYSVYYTLGHTVDQRCKLETAIRNVYNPPCGER